MKRGEVWWADMAAPVGRRPVLLISRNAAYAVRESVTVGTITRRIRRLPTEVRVGRAEGLPEESVVNLDDIATIPKAQLLNYAGELSNDKLAAVDSAIKFALALS